MTWALAGLLVVFVIVSIILAQRLSSRSASAKVATKTIEDTKVQLEAARQEVADGLTRVAAAQADVEQANRATEQARGRAELAQSGLAFTRQQAANSAASAQLEALWALACLEQDRAWRLTMAMPRDAGSSSGADSLVGAMEREVERIREETGTPGQLHAELPQGLVAGDAVVVLRALQGLLAVLTRYSDSFDLDVGLDDGRMVAAVICEGFDGPDTVADEATALLEALRPAQGEIDVERDEAGRLKARLVIPLLR